MNENFESFITTLIHLSLCKKREVVLIAINTCDKFLFEVKEVHLYCHKQTMLVFFSVVFASL